MALFFVFAYNEHQAIGGSGDCKGIFNEFSDALAKAFEIIDTFEDVSIEIIKNNEFETILYKYGDSLIMYNQKLKIVR